MEPGTDARRSPGTAKNPDDMTEAELAEYFYANRGDLAGDEVPSRNPPRLDVMISVRFSASEASEVRAAAARAHMSVSAYLRERALRPGGEVVDLERVRADLRAVRATAADALNALADES